MRFKVKRKLKYIIWHLKKNDALLNYKQTEEQTDIYKHFLALTLFLPTKRNKTVLFVFNVCYFYLEATTWIAIYIYLCVRSKFYIENFAQDLYDKVKLSDTQTITPHRYTDTQTVINMLTNKHTLLKASQMTQFIFNILYFRFKHMDVLMFWIQNPCSEMF